jgi:hypothetical protein
MKRHWKKIVGAVVVLIVLVLGASFLYTNVFHKARHEFVQSDVDTKLDAAVTTAEASRPLNRRLPRGRQRRPALMGHGLSRQGPRSATE